MRLAYGTGAYKRDKSFGPQVQVKNLYVEASPTNRDEHAVLIARPGLDLAYSLGNDPIRGAYRKDGVFAGDKLWVSGPTLFREEIELGEVSGVDQLEFAASDELVYVSGPVLKSTDGVSVSTVTFPDNAGVSSLCSVNGIVVAVRSDTGRMYFLLAGETEWGALDYFSAESEPDPVIAVRKVGNELWAFGSSTVQPFNLTGSFEAPFEPIQGREFLRGCRSRTSLSILDNTAFWVGEDGQAYRGETVPAIVSTPFIAERIAKCSPADLVGWSYSWTGHVFYVLSCGLEGTWVYDVSTQEWHEATSFGLDYWRAGIGISNGTEVFAGDTENGSVWQLSDASLTDGDDQIEKTFSAFVKTKLPIRCDVIEAKCATGFAVADETPVIEMRHSDDGGQTWTNWRSASLGLQGKYRSRALWRQCGLIDGERVFEFRCSDAVRYRISGVTMNETYPGRSRG